MSDDTRRIELCPVCEGSGKYDGKQCHGCSGKGWIPTPKQDGTAFHSRHMLYHSITDMLSLENDKHMCALLGTPYKCLVKLEKAIKELKEE